MSVEPRVPASFPGVTARLMTPGTARGGGSTWAEGDDVNIRESLGE